MIFMDENAGTRQWLEHNAKFGPVRCPQCIEAERLIQIIKEGAHKDGVDAAFYQANSVRERKSSQLNMR